jgi:predicted nuclease with TOPRIM domain
MENRLKNIKLHTRDIEENLRWFIEEFEEQCFENHRLNEQVNNLRKGYKEYQNMADKLKLEQNKLQEEVDSKNIKIETLKEHNCKLIQRNTELEKEIVTFKGTQQACTSSSIESSSNSS